MPRNISCPRSAAALALAMSLLSLAACTPPPPAQPPMNAANAANAASLSAALVHVLRLKPGDDLKESLDAYARAQKLEAAVLVTCVGSLTTASLRFADRPETTILEGRWEIVSLVGTLSATGGSHLHLAVSDAQGATRGGHLMPGSRIYTTAEIALAALPALRFERELDPTYGYHELASKPATR